MDIFIFINTLFAYPKNQCRKIRGHESSNLLRSKREAGEIILPFILSLMGASLLFLGLFLLNKLYEHRTKEHLREFQNHWNTLEQKYKD